MTAAVPCYLRCGVVVQIMHALFVSAGEESRGKLRSRTRVLIERIVQKFGCVFPRDEHPGHLLMVLYLCPVRRWLLCASESICLSIACVFCSVESIEGFIPLHLRLSVCLSILCVAAVWRA